MTVLPLHVMRRFISELGQGIPASGLFFRGEIKTLGSLSDPASRLLSAAMNTSLRKLIRAAFDAIPAVPGVHHVDLPLGMKARYLSLEHVAGCPAGAFVLDTVEGGLTTAIGHHVRDLSRKAKRRIQRVVGGIGSRWLNPLGSDIDTWFSAVVDRSVQEVERRSDDAFANTLTSYKDFVSSFSHEALSPIQEIRTSLEHAVTKSELDSGTQERLESSLLALDKLRVSLEGMRLLFRDDERRALANQFRSADLRAIVERWCNVYRGQFDSKNIQIILDPPLLSWTVKCIPEYVEVMVRNLLSNGVKYSFDASGYSTPGKFIVRFDRSVGSLSFINFGVPIAPAEISTGQLFTLGHRGRTADDRGRVGKGVGLHLVRRVTDLHGATCTVTSEVQNPGGDHEFARTEFKIVFRKSRGGL